MSSMNRESRKAHLEHLIQMTSKSTIAIKRFFYSPGDKLIPAALKFFETKTQSIFE